MRRMTRAVTLALVADARAVEHDGADGALVSPLDFQVVGGEARQVAGSARGLELEASDRAVGEQEEQVGLLRADSVGGGD